MGSVKDRNCMNLTEADDVRKRWQKKQRTIQKRAHDPDNHDGVISHLDPDIQEYEIKWVLGSITANKASGGDGIPVELFQLKDDAVKMLHSICQQIWKIQQWPQDWKHQFSFQSQRRQCQRMFKLPQLHSSQFSSVQFSRSVVSDSL